MNEPFSTIGIQLSYGTTKDGATQNKLYSIYSMPEMEGDPEQIDVTTLADGSRRYIPGVKESEALVFEGFKGKYGPEGAEDAARIDEFATLKAIEPDEALYWRLTYPDGSYHAWGGTVSARSLAAEVNGAATYGLSIMPMTEMEFEPAT